MNDKPITLKQLACILGVKDESTAYRAINGKYPQTMLGALAYIVAYEKKHLAKIAKMREGYNEAVQADKDRELQARIFEQMKQVRNGKE